jgi:DNA mismatch repair protein MutS
LNHATPRRLIILDEVGRGTSTYDGISIAWACVEYLHGGPKVLFATHYFELTQLSQQLPGVHNAHVTAREWGDQVVFLHKVEPGPADRAYGIHVAQLAGVPKKVLTRAQSLLQALEQNADRRPVQQAELPLTSDLRPEDAQAFETLAGWRDELSQIEINSLTPLEALVKLADWKKRYLEATSQKSKE